MSDPSALSLPMGVILTAGAGQRLYPLNQIRPKALMPLCNCPLLDYQIQTLLGLQTKQILIQIGVSSEKVSYYVKQKADLQNTLLLHDNDPSTFSMPLLSSYVDTEFALLDCDRISPAFPSERLVEQHRVHSATCTWALAPAVGAETSSWHWSENNKLVFYQKQGESRAYEHAGLIVATPQFIDHMINPKSNIPFDFKNNIPWYGYLPQSAEFWSRAPNFHIAEEANWYGYIGHCYAIDLGTPARYFRAHFDALEAKFSFLGNDNYRIHEPNGWIHPNARLGKNIRLVAPYIIGPSEIQARATIGPYAVIGKDCFISKRAKVSYSILWDRVQLSADSEIAYCVIADNVACSQSTSAAFLIQDPENNRNVAHEVQQIWIN